MGNVSPEFRVFIVSTLIYGKSYILILKYFHIKFWTILLLLLLFYGPFKVNIFTSLGLDLVIYLFVVGEDGDSRRFNGNY